MMASPGSSRAERERARRPLRVPAEIAANIAMYTNDDDLQSLCDATGTLTIDQANYHRYDPRPYLKNLVYDPDRLLSAMREWNVVLSGSRASAFFYPSATTENSDWDFYCTGGTVAAAMFSNALGAEWETSQRGSEDETAYNGSFLILRGSLRGHSIQLMWYNEASMGAFGTIVEFHSSIVQCFISGWCAVSMYHKVSVQNKMLVWELDGIRNPEKKAKAPRCVAKYAERGFEVIPYAKESIGVNCNLNLPWNPRCVSDEGCLLIDFKHYTTYANHRLDTLHDAAIEEIKSMKWSEMAGHGGRELRWSSGSVNSKEWGLYRCLRETEPVYTIWYRKNGISITFQKLVIDKPCLTICSPHWISLPQPARERQDNSFRISRFSPI